MYCAAMASQISSPLRLLIAIFGTPEPRKNLSYFNKRISFNQITISRSLVSVSSSSFSSTYTWPLQPLEQLPPKLQEIIKLFQSVQEPKAKYEQLLFYSINLKTLDAQFKTRENKVEGCVSQVWVRAYLDEHKNVAFEADSDSVLTKGLAALLVQGLSNRPVEEVVKVSPDFVVLLGLQQSLTPSRNNGFLNMLKTMQKKAIELVLVTEKASGSVEGSISESKTDDSGANSILEMEDDGGVENSSARSLEAKSESSSQVDSGENGSNSGGMGSRGMRIREKLEKDLRPVELGVEDISYQHAGHAGVRGSDGETHFTVKVVSKEFEGKSLVKRHRLIYDLLQEELQTGLHALSIVAKAPSEIEGR